MSKLSNISQLILRNQDLFANGKWMIANAADGGVFNQLETAGVQGFHQYFDVYQDACGTSPADNHEFSHVCTAQELDGAVVVMPKAKEHARMLLANLAQCVKTSGSIVLVGENKSGIKSADKLLQTYSNNVNKLDSARHCTAYICQVDKALAPFNLESWYTDISVDVANQSYTIRSLPGVFSHGELDIGTRLLLENCERVSTGATLDFACGAGVIGCFLALKNPKIDLTMSDVSALAVHCTEQSLALNNINAKVVASNGMQALRGKFAAIYTNPPFHTGIKTDYAITQGFINQATKHIQDRGKLILVANRFLKYHDYLEDAFRTTTVLAQTTKFSLYQSYP